MCVCVCDVVCVFVCMREVCLSWVRFQLGGIDPVVDQKHLPPTIVAMGSIAACGRVVKHLPPTTVAMGSSLSLFFQPQDLLPGETATQGAFCGAAGDCRNSGAVDFDLQCLDDYLAAGGTGRKKRQIGPTRVGLVATLIHFNLP